jgi:hypothetical protein
MAAALHRSAAEVLMFMRSTVLMSAMFAAAFTAAAAAQTPTTAQSNRTIPGTITVTGCVERADQVAGATAAAAVVDSLNFMLIHVENSPADAARPAGTSGTKGDEKGTSYKLDGDVATLNPHVGQKVEVSGTLLGQTATTTDAANPSSPANAPRLKVDSIKMLSETCAR